ncbi:MAG: hypothetical protein ACO3MB_13025, partial [Saprospiraceae bacterium]
CSYYTIASNADYLVTRLNANIKLAGAVFGHLGFGLMIIGVIASGLNEKIISSNPFVMQGLVDDEDLGKVIKLIKNERIFSEGYWISYQKDTIIDKTRYFDILFEKSQDDGEGIETSFKVKPNVLFSNDLTKVAASNPDAKHFLSKDVFVSIQSLPASQMDVELAMSAEDSLEYNRYELAIGDTLFTKDKYAVVEYLSFEPKHPDFKEENSDAAIAVGLRFRDLAGEYNKSIEPAISLADDMLYQYPDQIDELGVKVKINEESFDSYFSMEDALDYSEFIVSKEEEFEFNGLTFSLKGFDKNIDNRNYKAEDGDIAIKALVKFEDGNSNQLLKPVYLIRDNKPQSLKDYNPEYGIHIRMTHIDPVNERFN